MAITHADVFRSPKGSDLGTKTGASIMVFSILLGLSSFILCLVAEATRSQVNWAAPKGTDFRCMYTGSGKLPLLSAAAAFFALAIAILVHHTFLLVAVAKSDALIEVALDPNSAIARSLACQAGFFFVSTWMSFGVGEILLLIGLSIESGHLNKWATAQPSCLANKQGLFTAAGVLGLLAVFLASGLYITVLRVEIHFVERENWRREMLEAAAVYATPPETPDDRRVHGDRQQLYQNSVSLDVILHYYLKVFDTKWNIV